MSRARMVVEVSWSTATGPTSVSVVCHISSTYLLISSHMYNPAEVPVPHPVQHPCAAMRLPIVASAVVLELHRSAG